MLARGHGVDLLPHRCRSSPLPRCNLRLARRCWSPSPRPLVNFLRSFHSGRDGSCSMPTRKAIGDPSQSTFLSLEEAGLIEMTNLDMHEKFLARLTVSSLNLLKEISEQEGIPIEELNAGKLCDWFVRDKEKRAKNVEEATLKWDTLEW